MPDQTPALTQMAQSNAPTCGAGAEDWARPVMERQLQMLGRLAEAGLNIALAIEAQATGAGDAVVQDVAMAYARVSRAVRLTVMLQSQVIRDLQEFDHRQARKPAPAEAAVEARQALEDKRKASVERIVARVIDGAFDDEDQADYVERLSVEVSERLDDEDFCDVLSRPISEIVAMICGDLGLSCDWPRLAEEAWAQEEISSGKAGSPLAAIMAQRTSPAAHPRRRCVPVRGSGRVALKRRSVVIPLSRLAALPPV